MGSAVNMAFSHILVFENLLELAEGSWVQVTKGACEDALASRGDEGRGRLR